LVRPNEHERRFIGLSSLLIRVADDLQGHAERGGRVLERPHALLFGIEGHEREAGAELLEHVAAARQGLRREMMPGAGLERMGAVGAAGAVRRAQHHRGAFIVRLIGQNAVAGDGLARLPCLLELFAVALRAVAVEERPVR
jgi:hypothetical protein